MVRLRRLALEAEMLLHVERKKSTEGLLTTAPADFPVPKTAILLDDNRGWVVARVDAVTHFLGVKSVRLLVSLSTKSQ